VFAKNADGLLQRSLGPGSPSPDAGDRQNGYRYKETGADRCGSKKLLESLTQHLSWQKRNYRWRNGDTDMNQGADSPHFGSLPERHHDDGGPEESANYDKAE
jgi:hypothetical protein